MNHEQTILGTILAPRADGSVRFFADGAIHCDATGTIDFIGNARELPTAFAVSQRRAVGIIIPPFLDAHIHIPQHPIRGHFMDCVTMNPPEGRLLAGLNRNVFPTEAKCADELVARATVDEFARETLSQGVVGGAAYMTVHAGATQIALQRLGRFWSVGLVLMEMNCPEYLRVTAIEATREMRELAREFGRRFIVTDRFAVAVGSVLRRMGSGVAEEFGLRTQTHLNEQLSEKRFVEEVLYRRADQPASYTHVYHDDELLAHDAILAHCVHCRSDELDLIASTGSVVAHCPTSNTLLGSGVMPLDRIASAGINYAICTDVGASPTTSMLAEMAQFLKVHAGRSSRATPSQALYRSTLAPARILGAEIGDLSVGKPLSFIEIAAAPETFSDADDAILRGLLELSPADLSANREAVDELETGRLDMGPNLARLERDVRETAGRVEKKVLAVTVMGEEIWRRNAVDRV